jgi:oxygen-independent coproporphyrinogen-3 oxidase
LAIKRAANLNMELNKYRDKVHTGDIDSQLDIVTGAARDMGLLPYYLYRQKNISGNLENIGFSREGLECLYNILIMEERVDIAGIGAGSSCKYVKRPVKLPDGRVLYGPDGRIDRTENVKNVDEYIERIDEMLERKKQAFQAD